MLTDIFVIVCLVHFSVLLGNMIFVLIAMYEDRFWNEEDTMLSIGAACIPVYNILMFCVNVFHSSKYFFDKFRRGNK